jgi:DNA-binding phage protein
MPSPARIPRILAAARAEMKAQGTNPYQIAQVTGLATNSVTHLLLSENVSPSLRNIELVLAALGLEVQVVRAGPSLAKPGKLSARKRLKRG